MEKRTKRGNLFKDLLAENKVGILTVDVQRDSRLQFVSLTHGPVPDLAPEDGTVVLLVRGDGQRGSRWLVAGPAVLQGRLQGIPGTCEERNTTKLYNLFTAT